jgi:hypothetical protein
MARLPLTLAICEYDHVADVTNGRVMAEGIDQTCLIIQIEEIFFASSNTVNSISRKVRVRSMPL